MSPDGSCGESRLHKNDVSDGVAGVKPVPTSWILLRIREIEMEIMAMIAPPNSPGTKTAMMISFPISYQRIIAHRRVIVFLLVFAYAAFRVVHPDQDGRFFDLLFHRPLGDAGCQPAFLASSHPRPWGAIHPRKAPA